MSRTARDHRRGRNAALVRLLLLGLALGCATPQLPPGEAASNVAADAMRRVDELYLYPERIDRRLVVGALDALERRFDAVRFDESPRGGMLWVGAERAFVPLEEDVQPERFQEVLGRALAFVERHLDPDELPQADEGDDGDLELIALRGALAALDRYSTIFSGRSSEDFQIRFSGKLKGIGTRIGRRDGQLLAVNVFPDSPAERGGLRDGDAILYIDGDSTQPLTVSEAVGRIRGEPGSVVTLGILRREERREIRIVRGAVRIPTVEARLLADRLGYARIDAMSRSTVKEFREKVLKLGELDGLVLDLRGNSGGSMQTATRLADLFMARRTIVRVIDRRDPEGSGPGRSSYARAMVLFPIPLVILVDPQTASAAEIVTGALAPLRSALVVGQTTFGKGVIQNVLKLPQEKLLKLTVAEYRLSGNRVIHERGIDPDVTLFPVSSVRLGRLANVDPNALPYVRAPGEDDTFPIELAQALLQNELSQALPRIRRQADARIREYLDELSIRWRGEDEAPLERLPEPLQVRTSSKTLTAGGPTSVQLSIKNPNDVAVADLWAALDAPVAYLNALVALGTVPAGGTVSAEIELTPPNGIAVREHPVMLHLASRARHLQSEEIILHVVPHVPEIAMEILRLDEEHIKVTIHNRGPFDAGRLRIDVPGATRTIESLDPGTTVTRELRLSGATEHVAVTLLGPWAQRRIEIPIPEERVWVVPPEVVLERTGRLRRSTLRVHATSPEGLSQGWVSFDGQKQIFVRWDGQQKAELKSRLAHDRPHNVVSRVESLSGVAVVDSRFLTAN